MFGCRTALGLMGGGRGCKPVRDRIEWKRDGVYGRGLYIVKYKSVLP